MKKVLLVIVLLFSFIFVKAETFTSDFYEFKIDGVQVYEGTKGDDFNTEIYSMKKMNFYTNSGKIVNRQVIRDDTYFMFGFKLENNDYPVDLNYEITIEFYDKNKNKVFSTPLERYENSTSNLPIKKYDGFDDSKKPVYYKIILDINEDFFLKERSNGYDYIIDKYQSYVSLSPAGILMEEKIELRTNLVEPLIKVIPKKYSIDEIGFDYEVSLDYDKAKGTLPGTYYKVTEDENNYYIYIKFYNVNNRRASANYEIKLSLSTWNRESKETKLFAFAPIFIANSSSVIINKLVVDYDDLTNSDNIKMIASDSLKDKINITTKKGDFIQTIALKDQYVPVEDEKRTYNELTVNNYVVSQGDYIYLYENNDKTIKKTTFSKKTKIIIVTIIIIIVIGIIGFIIKNRKNKVNSIEVLNTEMPNNQNNGNE